MQLQLNTRESELCGKYLSLSMLPSLAIVLVLSHLHLWLTVLLFALQLIQ